MKTTEEKFMLDIHDLCKELAYFGIRDCLFDRSEADSF